MIFIMFLFNIFEHDWSSDKEYNLSLTFKKNILIIIANIVIIYLLCYSLYNLRIYTNDKTLLYVLNHTDVEIIYFEGDYVK